MGHFKPPHSPDYWIEFYNTIYLFHMPLFFLLSGYLFKVPSRLNYSSIIVNKSKRLLRPFISIALIFFFIKFIASKFFALEHPLTLNTFFYLFIDPVHSYMPALWFLYTLIIIFLVYPLLHLAIKNNWVIFCFIIIMNSISFTNMFCMNNVVVNMSYFITGIIMAQHIYLDRKIGIKKIVIISLSCFVLFGGIFFSYNLIESNHFIIRRFLRIILGIVGSILVIHLSIFVADHFNKTKLYAVLKMIGFYSMSIYLFHTFFVSAVRIVFTEVFKFQWLSFEIIAFIAICSGTLFPLLMEKYLLRPNTITKKYILGLSS